MSSEQTIEIKCGDDGHTKRVSLASYVTAKTKQLKAFGYENLTPDAVRKQVELLLAGKKWTDVIGGFCEDEVVAGSAKP